MSHAVTVTRTTTTTTTTAILLNTGHLKTVPGLLKLGQLLLGAVCVGIVSYYFTNYIQTLFIPEFYFLLVSVAALIGTFCLFVACLLSIATATIIPKTLFDPVYHWIIAILYLAAGILLTIRVSDAKNSLGNTYNARLIAAVLGIVVAILYVLSGIFALRSYRRG